MRLIDADALIISLAKDRSALVNNHVPHGELRRIDETIWKVAEAPAISAVPVVRGRWVVDECDTTDDVPSSSWIDFHCSECNTDYGLEEGQYGWCRYEKIPYQYCPNCGAKMEVEHGN